MPDAVPPLLVPPVGPAHVRLRVDEVQLAGVEDQIDDESASRPGPDVLEEVGPVGIDVVVRYRRCIDGRGRPDPAGFGATSRCGDATGPIASMADLGMWAERSRTLGSYPPTIDADWHRAPRLPLQ